MKYVPLMFLLLLGACRYDPALVGMGLGMMQPPPINRIVTCHRIGNMTQCF